MLAPPFVFILSLILEYSFREMGEISPFGEQWAFIVGPCRGWSFRANQRYTGPWTAAEGLRKTRYALILILLHIETEIALGSRFYFLVWMQIQLRRFRRR